MDASAIKARVSPRNIKFRVLMLCMMGVLAYFMLVMHDSLDRLDVVHEPVDFVISWVNGSDGATAYAAATSKNRWRDWDELRYAIRSIEAHAAWFRRLYLVVNNAAPGSLPGWLDLANERLVVTAVSELFREPDADLPTANSNAVEMNLHRLKGLSKRFVYMNNDWFINRHVDKSHFFHPRGHRLMFNYAVQGDEPTSSVPRDRALAYNKRLLDEMFGYKPRRQLDVHAPLGLDRAVLAEMETHSELAAPMNATSAHRTRNETDVVLAFVYPHYVASTGRGYPSHGPLWVLRNVIQFGLRDSIWRNRFYMLLINALNPTFFCVNDDVKGPAIDPAIGTELTTFLTARFPTPSMYEKAGSVN